MRIISPSHKSVIPKNGPRWRELRSYKTNPSPLEVPPPEALGLGVRPMSRLRMPTDPVELSDVELALLRLAELRYRPLTGRMLLEDLYAWNGDQDALQRVANWAHQEHRREASDEEILAYTGPLAAPIEALVAAYMGPNWR